MTRNQILKAAIEAWGPSLQEDICIEEMSELTKAIIKYRRSLGPKSKGTTEILPAKGNILEEIADVQIMLDQMRIIFGNTTEQENFKLERLEKRLDRDSP